MLIQYKKNYKNKWRLKIKSGKNSTMKKLKIN